MIDADAIMITASEPVKQKYRQPVYAAPLHGREGGRYIECLYIATAFTLTDDYRALFLYGYTPS